MKTLAHTDVVILGGGCSGVAAAVAAAKTGLNVKLIEKNAFLGGVATAAEVGTICGLYKYTRKAKAEYIVGSFARNFAESLKARSGTEPVNNSSGLHFLPYHIDEFKGLCVDLLRRHGVEVFLNTEVKAVDRRDSRIESVSLKAGSDAICLLLGSLVDCSGNAIASQLADLPLIESSRYQAAAQVFSMAGINETTEATLGLVIMKSLRSAINEKRLPDFFDRLYVVPGSLKGGSVSLKMGLPVPVTHKSGNAGQLKTTAQELVHTVTDYLVSNVPLFQSARLCHIAPQVGVRIGLRTMGKYLLTEEDVLQGRKFDDAVADVSWPIEEWELDKRVKMRYLNEDDFYQIPARCLQSNSTDNLFTAGRCLSATNAAIASARVMGACLQTGYAAGCLAAAKALSLSPAQGLNLLTDREVMSSSR